MPKKYLVLMVLVFSLLALGYIHLAKHPRTLEEDKSWYISGDANEGKDR